MLNRQSFFRDLLENREARGIFMNSLAVGEADSAIDLDRVAEHVADPALSRRIYRHFAEEKKHARLLAKRLAELGFYTTPLPRELDYERYAQRFGMGTAKARLDDPTPFSTADLILFFAGCKAGEERACKEMKSLIEALSADPETVNVLRTVYGDEVRHVSYATEELRRLAEVGGRRAVLRSLRATRRAEARAHRLVSRAFMRRLMGILGYPRWVEWLGGIAVDLSFLARWLFPGGLDDPAIRDAMRIPVDRERGAARPPERALEETA